MAAYLEAMVLVNPFLHLEEMQDRLMIDLNLLQNEVPSVPVICRTLPELKLSKHKSFSERHPFQRFLIGLPNNAVSILGATSRGLHASLAGNVFSTQKRLTDETTYEHTRNLFFKVIRKSLYLFSLRKLSGVSQTSCARLVKVFIVVVLCEVGL